MGKKSRPAILPSSLPEEDDVYDSEAELEMAALADLEAERLAEANELSNPGSDSNLNSNIIYNRDGLLAAAEDMESRGLPWLEQLDICSQEKLNIPDVHDDLARELAFYEMALNSVKDARDKLKEAGVSWKRPEDFFCEMIKPDTQMAKIKDKLIFEQKKMEAFEQRKERQTQKKFAKATADTLQKDKAAAKKDNIEAVNKWRRDNADRRKGDKLQDNDEELERLIAEEENGPNGKSRKRKNLDRKYGFGGEKNKKATRNDDKSLNNTRGFNPKAMKAQARGKGGKGGGKGKGNRPGKDSRNKQRHSNM